MRGALNFPPHIAEGKLREFFLQHRAHGHNTAIVMYCEFSSERGPRALSLLRAIDRAHDLHRYPNVDFPYVYLLEGGYSQFFAQHKTLCEPQNYIRMDAPEHRQQWAEARKIQRMQRASSTGCSQRMPVDWRADSNPLP